MDPFPKYIWYICVRIHIVVALSILISIFQPNAECVLLL